MAQVRLLLQALAQESFGRACNVVLLNKDALNFLNRKSQSDVSAGSTTRRTLHMSDKHMEFVGRHTRNIQHGEGVQGVPSAAKIPAPVERAACSARYGR